MKKISLTITGIIILITCITHPLFAAEPDFSDTATGKASTALISSFTNYVKDVTAMNGMTDQQKMDYILKVGKERIWEETASRAKDKVKDKMLEYIALRARADMFKSAVPAMMHQAIMEGKSLSSIWSAVDVDVSSKLDTHMNALKAGIGTAQVGWAVYSTWSTKGPEEGCRELGKQVGEKIIEYFIPGWGYYRLAQAAVEAIGQYVVGYAFDTALQGKMQVLLSGHNPKTNPKAFKAWILSVDIARFVQREWDEQLAYDGFYLKGKNNEGADMKIAMIDALTKMREDIKNRMAIEAEVRAKLEAMDSQVRSAASGVQGAISSAGKDAAPVLDSIDSFKTQVYELKKQDYQQVVDQAQAITDRNIVQSEKASPTFKYEDVAFSHEAILNALRDAFASFTESGTEGYDEKIVEAGVLNYQEIRKQALEATWKSIQDLIKQGEKVSVEAQARFRPQMDAVRAKMVAYLPKAERDILDQQYSALQEDYRALTFPYANISYVFGSAYQQNVEMLVKEEQLVIFEVMDRVMGRRASLDKMIEEFKSEIEIMTQDYVKLMQEHQDMRIALNDYSRDVLYLKDNRNEFFMFYNLGDAISKMGYLEELKAGLIGNKELEPQLNAIAKKALDGYIQGMDEMIKRFESSIPKALQIIEKSADGENPYECILSVKGVTSPVIRKILSLSGQDQMAVGILFGGNLRYIAQIPRVWDDTSKDAASYAKYFSATQQASRTAEGIAYVSALITEMDYYDSVDRTALNLSRVMNDITNSLIIDDVIRRSMQQEAENALKLFRDLGNADVMSMEPEKSRGAQFLGELKMAWAGASARVDQIEKLFKTVDKSMKYGGGFNEDVKTTIDTLKTIPDRIALYEDQYRNAQKAFNNMIKRGNENLANAKKQLKEIEKGYSKGYSYKECFEMLQNFEIRVVNHNLATYETWADTDEIKKLVGAWRKFAQETETAVKDAKEDVEKEDDRRTDLIAKSQEKRFASLQADAQGWGGSGLTSTPMYEVHNARINTRLIPFFSGDIVLMPDDLRQGSIDITARLNTIDYIERILFSEDGGRTWTELPLQADIASSIRMLPDKEYNPMLRIKSSVANEFTVSLFGNLNIIYRDINIPQMVAQSVKQVAEAYERMDAFAFSQLISRNYMGNKAILEEGVRFDFDLFMNIRLTIYINRIEKRGSTYIAETKWDKDQTPRTTGMQQKTSGNTTMVFVLEDGQMKIQNLRGNLIYATLSPQIAQASGLSASIIDQIRTAADARNPTQPGAGTIEDDGGVTATHSGPVGERSITVTAPNSGDTISGSPYFIEWTVTGIDESVSIHLSTDGGGSFPTELTADSSTGTPGPGFPLSFGWSIQPLGTPQCDRVLRLISTIDNSVTADSGSFCTN